MNERWRVIVDELPGGSKLVAPRRVRARVTEYGPQVIVDPPSWLLRLCGDTLERRVEHAKAQARLWCIDRNAAEAVG